jgi:hypothetical protein
MWGGGGATRSRDYGDIPDDIVFEKFYGETATLEPSSEEQLDSHNRRNLRDLTPDKPFLASDEARNGGYDPETGESRSGGSFSRQRISLQYSGTRRDISPHLPEGTFTDHEFLAPDPRGTSDEPNMRLQVKHAHARHKFKHMTNDDDPSIPESGINPTRMEQYRKRGYYDSKERMKWFGTSRDNHIRGGLDKMHGRHQSPFAATTHDGEVIDINHASLEQRRNRNDIISNAPNIGWQTTPDHEVDVAKYGDIRRLPSLAQTDFVRNRHHPDMQSQSLPVEMNGMYVSKELVLQMMNMMRNKKTQFTSDGTRYGDSLELENKDQIFYNRNGGGTREYMGDAESTRDNIARLAYEYDQVSTKNSIVFPESPGSMYFNSEMPLQVAQFMDEAIRRQAVPNGLDDIKRYIEVTVDEGLNIEERQRKLAKIQGLDAPSKVHFLHRTDPHTDDREVKQYSSFIGEPARIDRTHLSQNNIPQAIEQMTYQTKALADHQSHSRLNNTDDGRGMDWGRSAGRARPWTNHDPSVGGTMRNMAGELYNSRDGDRADDLDGMLRS